MAKDNNKSRRAIASPNKINEMTRAGAYDNLPLNAQAAANMPYGRPSYGNATGSLRSVVNTELPDNVYGPQLPDPYASARAYANQETRRMGGDDVSSAIAQDQALYDMNINMAARQFGEPSPQDVADVYNDPYTREQAMPGSQDIRTMLVNRLRARAAGGQLPPTSGNVTGRQ